MKWTHAAVMLAAFADAPHGVVLIERSAHLRRHPSQVGLPGGRADAADGGDRARTALREMHEELGVAPERLRVVGRLRPQRQTLNGFVVTPIVAVLDAQTPLIPDGVETLDAFTIPLQTIVAKGAIPKDEARSAAIGHTTYAIDYDGHHVWGFTAGILRSFARAWHMPASPIRAAMQSAFRGD
ncbi:MAG TPA: CoA pyrophosphatase [Candidatus Cybelea sp.]|nr:CoA pyrophosphatase [Candidatus Cybelea sp.]